MGERACVFLQLLLSKNDELGLVYFGATGKPISTSAGDCVSSPVYSCKTGP